MVVDELHGVCHLSNMSSERIWVIRMLRQVLAKQPGRLMAPRWENMLQKKMYNLVISLSYMENEDRVTIQDLQHGSTRPNEPTDSSEEIKERVRSQLEKKRQPMRENFEVLKHEKNLHSQIHRYLMEKKPQEILRFRRKHLNGKKQVIYMEQFTVQIGSIKFIKRSQENECMILRLFIMV